LPSQQVRKLRGEDIAYVPQDPASALNPSIRIGKQIVELMELRGLGTADTRLQGARDGLAEVGLPNDDEFLRRYSHQLSGGQVQRVALAMAFLPKPKVLVLDEPTTGLDVTTQGMVLETMGELCRTHGVAALYVTHDLAVIHSIADRVAVMYAGQIAELGARETIFAAPTHPYTRALLDSIPHLSQARALSGIPGRTPAPGARPHGCRFHDRCEFVVDACKEDVPALREIAPGHQVRCIRAGEIGEWDISRGAGARHRPRQAAQHHPQPGGPRHLLRPQAGGLRRHLRRRQGRGGGTGRRVRLRQDHDLALRRWPAQGLDRRDRVRRHPARTRLAQPQRR
jgi:peptide/nickel transport system ATP-binding protein